MLEQTRTSRQHLNTPDEAIPIEHIYAAYQRSAVHILRTPLIRLNVTGASAEIYLKLETLQPVGSFKLRGAASALTAHDPARLKTGVWTASAGNMGYALAWLARRLAIPCAVVVPHEAPAAKIQAILAQGAQIHPLPFPVYQEIQSRRSLDGTGLQPHLGDRILIHPFADDQVMAGNGVIGLEILEDLPDVQAVLVPYGGGGLSCGIASALHALRPQARVYACEVDTAAPLAASLAAGRPVEVSYTPSFVSGMGAPFVFPEMWPRASRLLAGSQVVSLEQVAGAIRALASGNHVVAEGAGAVPVAAALAGMAGQGKIVCIVSGGNIDLPVLARILQEEPQS
jgi:threonine dehydratase